MIQAQEILLGAALAQTRSPARNGTHDYESEHRGYLADSSTGTPSSFDFPIGRIFDVQSLAQTLSESGAAQCSMRSTFWQRPATSQLYRVLEAPRIRPRRYSPDPGSRFPWRLTIGGKFRRHPPRARRRHPEARTHCALLPSKIRASTPITASLATVATRAFMPPGSLRAAAKGFADAVFVPETAAGEASGYVTCNSADRAGWR